jgi:hypothetical protein
VKRAEQRDGVGDDDRQCRQPPGEPAEQAHNRDADEGKKRAEVEVRLPVDREALDGRNTRIDVQVTRQEGSGLLVVEVGGVLAGAEEMPRHSTRHEGQHEERASAHDKHGESPFIAGGGQT